MEFFLITCAVMAAVIVGIHKMTDYLGFEMKWRPLALCAVMAVAANLITLLVSSYITFDYVALIVILIIASAALMTYYNEYLLRRDLEWEPEETALEKVEAKLDSVAAGNNRQTMMEAPERAEQPAVEAIGAPEPERIAPEAWPVDIKPSDLTSVAEFPPEPAVQALPVTEPIVTVEAVSETEPEAAYERSPEAVSEIEPIFEPEMEAVSEFGSILEGPPEDVPEFELMPERALETVSEPEPVSEPELEPVQPPDISGDKLAGLSTLSTLDDFLDYAYSEKGEGNLATAAAALAAAVEKFGDDSYAPFIVIELANVYKAQGDYQAAVRVYRDACRLPAVAGDEITLGQFKGSEEYLLKLMAVLESHGTPKLSFTEIPEDYFREII